MAKYENVHSLQQLLHKAVYPIVPTHKWPAVHFENHCSKEFEVAKMIKKTASSQLRVATEKPSN